MSSSKLTMIGLYKYDPQIFDNLSLPEGLDKDTLIDNILLRSGEFEVMYPDADFMKFSIGAWSRKWSATITRWVNALAIEYNPLENYDRYEHWTDNRDIAGSEGGSSSGSTEGTTGSTTTNKVSAYDAGDALTTHDQSESQGSDSTSNSGEYSSEHSTDDDLEHDGHIHGNIGVTTSQQMLLSELDLGYWNIYEKITDLFLTEFVIPIY